MQVLFERSFYRDLKRIHNSKVRKQVWKIIEVVERASTLAEVPHIVKLRGYETFYRIRLGDYRMGLEVTGNTVIFVRFLHRRDIYRYFP